MPSRRTAAALAILALALTSCSGHTGGYDIEAICLTAKAPTTTVADLTAIRDAIIAAAPTKLEDPPKGKPFKKFRLGIKLGTEAGTAVAPYAIPERLRQSPLPNAPDATKVRQAQQELAAACR